MPDLNFDKGKIAIALAGLVCLFAVYGAITDFRLPDKAQAVEPSQPIIEPDPVEIDALATSNLFGAPPPVVTTTVSRKETPEQDHDSKAAERQTRKQPIKVNISVTGVLASADQDFAAAIMKVDNTPERLYRVGEDLGKAEIILQSVRDESVIIDNNGNEQTFALKRPGLESSSGQTNRNPVSGGAQQFNQSNLPPLPPELEIPAEEYHDAGGAYAPELPDVNLDEIPPPLPEDLEEEYLQQELARELESDHGDYEQGYEDHGEYQEEYDDHSGYEDEPPPPPPEEDSPGEEPNFQMPVF